ncbi:DUF2746 domain-containing protein [Salinispora tropica]|uniref:DUF2746 domain-containing protein n=1 Tax=Salinispora tropica TaxID=168695 RepID=UPI000A2F4EE3|nr:DUF2746 domain-containing protein [Salinispora tropica]
MDVIGVDVIAAELITAGGAVLVALIGAGVEVLRRQSKRLREVGEQVVEQVVNDHPTNLRDDLDKVVVGLEYVRKDLAVVITSQRRQDEEIAGIREEQRIHRLEHIRH